MANKTISVELKKKTIQSAVSQIDMLKAMDMGKHREGDAMFELVKEIKKTAKRTPIKLIIASPYKPSIIL